MLYRVLADLVVVLHAAFILFAVLGGLLALRWGWVTWAHIPAAVWGAAIELFGWLCPLTPLENWLRRGGGAATYTGGFIEHYLVPLVYPAGLTREVQILLGCGLLIFNLAVYLRLWHRAPSTRRRAPATLTGRSSPFPRPRRRRR
jgi:hypothetical protein